MFDLFKRKQKQSQRYSKEECDLSFDDLKDYEKSINMRIRQDDNYKILHNKLILVSPFEHVATLYCYKNKKMIIVGEVSFEFDNKYIAIRKEFKSV